MTRFVTICWLVVLICCSQSIAKPAFGLRFGSSKSSISITPSDGPNPTGRSGYVAGFILQFAIDSAHKWFISTDAMYVQKGWSWKYPNWDGAEVKERYFVDEFVLSPMMQYRTAGRRTHFYIEFGPEIGFNTRDDVEVEVKADNYSWSGTMINWPRTSYSINAGLGVILQLVGGEVMLGARYNLGLKNMYEGQPEEETGRTLNAKVSDLQFLLGYNFSVPVW